MKKDQRDRRRSTRIEAWVTLDGSFAKRACTILDVSDTGARVQFHDLPPQSSVLRLVIAGDVRAARLSRVIWRRGNVAGLQFAAAPQSQTE
jgi:hypothetical protein